MPLSFLSPNQKEPACGRQAESPAPQEAVLNPWHLHWFGAVWIRSSDGDCAPSPSHTTVRTVFRIRRLNPAAF